MQISPISMRACHLSLTSLLAGLSLAGSSPPAMAQSPSLADLQYQVQLAICQNQWPEAAALMGPLIATAELTPESRAELVEFRQQLLVYQGSNAVIGNIPGCDTMLARYVDPAAIPQASQPLNWAGALSRRRLPDQQARQAAAMAKAGLTDIGATAIPALSPATFIDTAHGFGVSAGAVSYNENIFSFFGGQGDRVNLTVNVTQMAQGALYADDDSQLFLFDDQGRLLAENDDLSRLQSQIASYPLPRTGTYYIAVTTYNNDPILDGDRKITGWSANGGSAIDYTLTVTGLTPTAQLAQPLPPP